jgi:hypothetical protein
MVRDSRYWKTRSSQARSLPSSTVRCLSLTKAPEPREPREPRALARLTILRTSTLDPLSLRLSHNHREMPPATDSCKVTTQKPLPPQHAQKGHTVLPQLGPRKDRRLDGVGADNEQEHPVLDLGGPRISLRGLEKCLVDDGARGDERAPGDQGREDGGEGVGYYTAGVLPQGEAGDLDGLGGHVGRNERMDG